MSFQGKLKRFLLILEQVKHTPTFAQLQEHLQQHGFALSARTLQRDIEQIRVELGLEIGYDRTRNTYHLPATKEGRHSVLPLLERAVLGELLAASGSDLRSTADVVLMERNGALQGLQHWGTLLRAIRERRWVEIAYQRFQKEEGSSFRMRPFLLKEYGGRWYVLGLADGYDNPISLGLDRITGLVTTTKRFAATERAAVEAFYTNVIGVDASAGKVERVVLRFTPVQGKYVKALPLHPTQKVVKEDRESTVIELLVHPNRELHNELLAMGDGVRVMEPASLVKAIAKAHKAAAKQYK
ncbi:MAG: WYL domain-containing protein [Flavobacteriales bacterium]